MAEDVQIRVGVDDRASAALKRVAAATEAVDKAAKDAGKDGDKAYVQAQRKAALLDESAKTQLRILKIDKEEASTLKLSDKLLRNELALESKLQEIKSQGLSAAQEELEIERAKLDARRKQEGLIKADRDSKIAAAKNLALGAAGITAAAGAAFVAFLGESAALSLKASEAYLEGKRGLESLEESLWRAGDAGDALTKRLDGLNAETARLARLSNFDQPELLTTLSLIVDLSGQAEQAQQGLSLAVAISTKRGKSLEESSTTVAKAMKGEIDALRELTPLSAKQAEGLAKIEDESKRAAQALKILEATYGGVLEGQDRTYLSMRALKVAQDELLGSIGEVVTESGVLAVVMEPAARMVDRLTGYIQDNRAELKLWLLEGLDRGVEVVQKFTGLLEKNADVIAGGVTVLRLGAGAFRIYLDVVMAVNKAIFAFTTGILSGAVGAIEQLLWVATKAAEVVDEDLAMGLRAATEAAQETSTKLAGFSLGALESAGENIGDIGKAFEDMGTAIQETDLVESKLRAGLKIIGDEADTARKEIAKLKAEVDKPTTKKRAPAPPKPPKVAPDDSAKRAAEEAARLRLQALDTQDKEIRAALEYQAKLKEIEGQKLKGAQGELARRQAALESERALDDVLNDRARTQAILLRLETAGREARTKGQKERVIEVEYQAKLVELRREDLTLEERALKLRELDAERRTSLRELEAEAIDEQAASWERVASNVNAAASGAQGYGKVVGEGLSSLVGGFGQIDKIAKQSQAGILSAAEASSQGIEAAGGAITSFAGALGASAAEQAGILALFETASAFASFAVGDVFGGGQHLLAAGLYTAVAASSGGSAPNASAAGGAGAGGAAGGAGQQREQRSDEASQRRGARVIAEEIAGALGKSSQPITVIYDQRGSVMADSPAGQRRLYEATAAGGRQVGADLNDLKRRRIP